MLLDKSAGVEQSVLIYGFWAVTSGVILTSAALASSSVRARDRYLSEVLGLLDTAREGELDPAGRSEALCKACRERTGAGGIAFYASHETGLKKLLQSGESAEVTGPGVVRDLLLQAINTGKPSEAVQGGRFLMSLPVSSANGAALMLFWEDEVRPTEQEKSLLEVTTRLLSLLLPALNSASEVAELKEVAAQLRSEVKHERQELEKEMDEEHHLASVGRLAAGVAHELNTPLGAVLTMVSSLLRKEEDANKKKRLTIVNDAVIKCKDIINKLMVYSRSPVQTEQGLTFSRFVRAETDLNSIINGIAEMMAEDLKKDNIELKLNLGKLPPLRANGSQWSHVITNLLANARDVVKEHEVSSPKISVSTSDQKGKILVKVADNGPGVPKEHKAKIFEPFFTTKDVGQGTGLGLAICREIVRKHQGDIQIKDAPGGGALFEILLNPEAEPVPVTKKMLKEQYP